MPPQTTPRSALTRIGPWVLGDTLGRGAYAHVRRATHLNGHKAACKILPALHRPLGLPATWDETVDAVEAHKEVVLLKALWGAGLEGVVGLEGVIQDGGWTYVFLTLYPYSASSLKIPWARERAVPFFLHLCHVVNGLHALNISHEDIKRSNVLVDEQGFPKLVDFGFSHFKPYGGLVKSAGGTLDYSSPEKAKDILYDPKANDVYSLGVLLLKLLDLPHPYATYHPEEGSDQVKRRLKAALPFYRWRTEHKETGLSELIEGMLDPDPKERWTLGEVFAHPYLQMTPPCQPPIFHPPPSDEKVKAPPHIMARIREDLCFLRYLCRRHCLCETEWKVKERLENNEPNWEKQWALMLYRWETREEAEWEDILPVSQQKLGTPSKIPRPARKQTVPAALREIHLTPKVQAVLATANEQTSSFQPTSPLRPTTAPGKENVPPASSQELTLVPKPRFGSMRRKDGSAIAPAGILKAVNPNTATYANATKQRLKTTAQATKTNQKPVPGPATTGAGSSYDIRPACESCHHAARPSKDASESWNSDESHPYEESRQSDEDEADNAYWQEDSPKIRVTPLLARQASRLIARSSDLSSPDSKQLGRKALRDLRLASSPKGPAEPPRRSNRIALKNQDM